IGNVLGINTDEISSVDFAPGTAFLLETNESKIKKTSRYREEKTRNHIYSHADLFSNTRFLRYSR
ncbi:hypothetical protein, partial [Campylobacter fetus]